MSKNGKPFVRVSVKTADTGNEYVSGLWFGADCPWKVGDKIMMEIKKETYNGKESLKFELPKKENPNAKQFEEIMNTLTKHGLQISQALTSIEALQKKVMPDDYPYPEKLGYKVDEMANFDPKPEDEVPF
jgi:hypothetical protein